MKLVLVAAVAADGGIGRGNDLLFKEVQDQRHFRAVTLGKPVLMGRHTWESLPARFRPLPGRRNVVVSRQATFEAPGAETAPNLAAALQLLAQEPEVCVIGGGQLYAEAMAHADTLELTEVAASYPGTEVFFPRIDPARFTEVQRRPAVAADGTPFAFVTYRRTGRA